MAGGEPRGPAGRGVLTWPAEPAEVVGVAAHCGAVGGGGEAVAAAQGLELHGVLHTLGRRKLDLAGVEVEQACVYTHTHTHTHRGT